MPAKRIALLSLLIAALLLAACAPTSPATEVLSSGSGAGADTYAAEAEAPAESAARQGVPPADPGAERVVIKTANLALVVGDPVEISSRIAALANSLNGFVVNSYSYQASVDAEGNKIMQANITVRVPSEHLDSVVEQLKGWSVEVRTASISGQDVTQEYTDLQSRLRNLEAAEAQLMTIMDRATRTEDVLSVFNQLTAIRDQIEQVKGRIEYFSQAAALSAITVELIPDALSQPLSVGGWRPQGVAKDALEALVRALQGLATAGIWLAIYVLPLALLVLLPIYLVIRLAVRRARRGQQPTAAA